MEDNKAGLFIAARTQNTIGPALLLSWTETRATRSSYQERYPGGLAGDRDNLVVPESIHGLGWFEHWDLVQHVWQGLIMPGYFLNRI